MNISCTICTDSYQSSDTIVTTINCGHCFHFHCLTQWLETETSQTCPECRSRCTRFDTRRIFLNIITNAEDTDTTINDRQQKQSTDETIESLKAQIISKDETEKVLLEEIASIRHSYWVMSDSERIKTIEIEDLKREIEQRKQQEEKYKKTIMYLEESAKMTEASYKEEIKLLKTENDNVQSENTELKEKVGVMKKVEDILLTTAADFFNHQLENKKFRREQERNRFSMNQGFFKFLSENTTKLFK